MKKYLAFLDIDGVFTSNRVHFAHNAYYRMWSKFDPVAVDFCNKMHDTYNVEFVLCSTWKNHLETKNTNIRHWVESSFANAGFRGIISYVWKTDPENTMWANVGHDRAHEVKAYLEEHEHDDFIIFDDSKYMYDSVLGVKRLVYTDCDNGLLFKHMLNAWSIMGTWKKK